MRPVPNACARGAAIVLMPVVLAAVARAAPAGGRPRPQLVWHVESASGEVVDSRGADQSINPASVVKVATSLWALERLGPEHRFETSFGIRGRLDDAARCLEGDLLVLGGADPDFHTENAILVAQALNRLGLDEVRGSLLVSEGFWIGWEGGRPFPADSDPRARRMGDRLRKSLDHRLWDEPMKRVWRELRERRGLSGMTPPRVVVRGPAAPLGAARADAILLVHRSNPLATMLKRFNAYSNNDIGRLGTSLGRPLELEGLLAERWGVKPESVRLETLSGLGTNRLSPRLVVRLLHELRHSCAQRGVSVADILPVAGCDPGTLTHFPRLSKGAASRALVAKTGTLTTTDGGVAVLAGIASTAQGELVFCVAAPRSGTRLLAARGAEESWLVELIARHGGALPQGCPFLPGHSDDRASIMP